MPGVTMILSGADSLIAKIQTLAVEAPVKVGAGLYLEAQAILAEATKITPIDTGALRASGHVEHPTIDGLAIEVRIGYGGASAPYALFVHERLDLFHEPPTQAKFLEATMNAHAADFAGRLAVQMKLGL